MSQGSEQPSPQDNQWEWQDPGWQSGLARPLLIATLATALVIGPLTLVGAFYPDARLGLVPPLVFLIALLAVYSTRWRLRPAQRLLHHAAFQAGQVVLLLAILRVATWLISGNWPGIADARQWLLEPLSFFDGFYVITALLALLAWDRGGSIAAIFQQLALTSAELAWYEEQKSGAWRRRMPVDLVRTSRQTLVAAYTTQWLLGGALLVITAGLSRVRITRAPGVSLLELGIPPQVIAAIVAYFLIGLVLASQARLAMLRAQWLFEGVEGLAAVPRRWQRLSLVVILGIGLGATLLPLGSTWRAGEILAIVFAVVAQVLYAIVFGLFALFAMLMSLLGLAGPPEERSAPPLPEFAPLEELPEGSSGLPPWLGGAGFWLIAIGIVLYALVYVLGRQGIALNWASLTAAWQRLMAALRSWWFGVRYLARNIQYALPGRDDGAAAEAGRRRQPWRFFRLGGLPPREKIRYFYLSTVRRAGEKGVARRPSQTPLEFVQDLEATWPEAELDVEALTDAFVAARYDVEEISQDEAQEVQTIWQRVKRALRRRKAE